MTNLRPGGPSHRNFSVLAALLVVCGVSLALANSAQGTALASSPSTVSFGTVALGTRNTQTLAVKNTSATRITVTVASITGSGFSVSPLQAPLYIGVGATTYITVSFAPTSSGTFAGTLALKNINSTLVLSVGLSGAGAGSTKSLVASTSALNFGNETVGDSTTLAVTLSNTGTSSVTISGFSISNSSYSVVGGLTGATLAAGQRATLNIVFAPKSIGAFSGTVTVVSNATNTAPKVTVSGMGISSTAHSVALSWSPSTSTGVVGYNVYRSTVSGASYSRLNSSPTASTRFTDGSVISNATYYYVVTAVNSGGGESVKSSQITAVIP